MAVGAHAYRRTIERRAVASTKSQRQKRKKTNGTPEKDYMISVNQTPGGYKSPIRATCGKSTMASEPARARLLWAILSLVLPVAFGHITACRSSALASAVAIHFAMKCSAPCSAVLRYFPPSWAAVVVHWLALMPIALRSPRKHPIHSIPCPPHSPRPPPILQTSRTSAVSYPPRAPQIPRTKSISCVKSPRCSHFQS